MKTKVLLFCSLVYLLGIFSCNKNNSLTPSANLSTENRNISGYSKLSVSDPFKVYVTFSDSVENVQVRSNSNLQQYIKVEKQNSTLRIYLDQSVDISGTPVLEVYVTATLLDEIYGVGASYINLENTLVNSNLTIELEGACLFNGELDVSFLNSNISGASNLSIEGNSTHFDLDISGGSLMGTYDFATDFLEAELSGGSSISLTVNQELSIEASDASSVLYKGDGLVVEEELSGGSSIQHVN